MILVSSKTNRASKPTTKGKTIMASKNTAPVTARTVREFFAADPKRAERLKTDKARHTVAEGARGRLHPEVIAAFNKGRKPERQYVLGVGVKAKAEAAVLREKVVAAGGGTRGPIKADVLAKIQA